MILDVAGPGVGVIGAVSRVRHVLVVLIDARELPDTLLQRQILGPYILLARYRVVLADQAPAQRVPLDGSLDRVGRLAFRRLVGAAAAAGYRRLFHGVEQP